MVSGATVTSDGYLAVAAERARPGRPVSRAQARAERRSPLRRARHGDADQPRRCAGGTPTTRAARRAWQAALAVLREVDRVFSTYRDDSVVSRLGRGEVDARRTARPRWPRCSRSASSPRRESGGAFDVRRRRPRRRDRARPERRGEGLGRRARRRGPATRWPTPTSASPPAATWSAAPAPGAAGLADRHRGPARPDAGSSPSSRPQRRGRHLRRSPTAAPTSSTPAPGGPRPGVASVTVVGPDLTWADIDATAAFALGPDALDWLRGRPGRSGLVVWADGTTTLFGAGELKERPPQGASSGSVAGPSCTAPPSSAHSLPSESSREGSEVVSSRPVEVMPPLPARRPP